MKFNKYSAIYKNDDLKINDNSIVGAAKDVKTYFRYELANQCMSDLDYENLIFNANMIMSLLEVMEENISDENVKIMVWYNPMGSLEYEELRVCSECGKFMDSGYVIENGLEYYCNNECLHKHYSDDEYNKMYDNGNGDSYWTSWEV